MKIISIIGALICALIGFFAIREAINTCWEGYVSPPLNLSDLRFEAFYICFSFVPFILIANKLYTNKWQIITIGGVEIMIIGSIVYGCWEVITHGH